MIRHSLGNTGYQVSAIAYGGIVSMNDGQANSDRYVSWAIDQGINYFDVAPSYGDAQEKLGNSLVPYRGDIFLACKTELRLRRDAEAEMLQSLKLLHTDHFNVYQMHAMSTMQDVELAFGPGGVMEMMREMKEKGIAHKIGFTAHSEDVALRCLELYDFDTVLFPFNWHMHMAHDMGSRLIHAAREKGVGLLCMKSMIERAWDDEERYASKYPKSWCKPIDTQADTDLLLAALRYAVSLGVDTLIPPGNFEHFSFAVEHADEIFNRPLGEADLARLRERLEEVKDRPFFDAN